MSEAIYHKVQLGRESSLGTSVAATTVFPVDAGFLGFELDRASETPDEDFGRASRNAPGRSSTGLRGADASLPFVMRFQDFMHVLEMHAAGSVSPTGTDPYTYVYVMDQTSSTLKPYTVEYGDINSTQDEFEAAGVICNELQIGFDALSAPGNSMWRGTLGLLALNRTLAAMTAGQSAPTTLETMEGHTTTLAYGGTATAFGSLSALTGTLKSFSLTSTLNAARRAYGGSSDVATAYGRSEKALATFEAMIGINATSDTNIIDIFEVAGNIPTSQRWRISIDGTGDNVMHIDFRHVMRSVNIGEHEGERLYAVTGETEYDATLASHLGFTLINNVASVP